MRLSFILDSFGGGGKERRILQLVQGLNIENVTDIQFIIINNGIAYPEIFQTSAKINIIDRKNRHLSYLKTLHELRNLLGSFNPDIVQGWGFLSLFFLNIIRLTLNFKYLASHVANTNKPRGINKITNAISNLLCDAIIGNSKAGLNAFSVPSKKAYCIYNGFNVDRLNKINGINKDLLKKQLGVETSNIVSMIARVDDNKDYYSFVAIAREILNVRNDVTFLAIGKGKNLEHFMDETKNDEKILFLGFREDVEQILSITNISLLCTNYKIHAEGISNTILESMALGVPVIATNGGGTPEIIENGKNGYCIDNNNIEEYVKTINNLLDNPPLYDSFSKECIKTVDDRFTLDKSTSQYLALYRNLLN